MRRMLGYGGLLFWALSGALPGGCATHECTEIGCIDGYGLTMRRSDGTAPTERVEVDYNDEHVVCPLVSLDERYAACSIAVSLTLRDQVICHETSSDDAQSQTCTPTGDYELALTIQGLPATVRVTLHDAEAVVHDRTFAPKYHSSQPNGEGCEPTCRQASSLWALDE